MRAEFVNLLRWRLERDLRYKTTHALQTVNTAGHPIYTMVFATDSTPGDRIMAHVYGSAATRTIPAMQARAQAARQRRREEAHGVMTLPGLDGIECVPSSRASGLLIEIDLVGVDVGFAAQIKTVVEHGRRFPRGKRARWAQQHDEEA
jgi:hypothetical protein